MSEPHWATRERPGSMWTVWSGRCLRLLWMVMNQVSKSAIGLLSGSS